MPQQDPTTDLVEDYRKLARLSLVAFHNLIHHTLPRDDLDSCHFAPCTTWAELEKRRKEVDPCA